MFFSRKDWRHLKVLTVSNIKARYRNTFYGFAWVILNPILTYLVQVFAFMMLFQVRIENYPVYLLSGLFPWIFLLQSVEMCTSIFHHHFHIIKNYPINPALLVWIQVCDNLINFILAFSIIMGYFLLAGKIEPISVLYFIVPFFSLVIAVISVCMFFAALNVRYRDVKFVVSFVFSLLFYLTPIFYSIRIVPEYIAKYFILNPAYLLIRPIQESFIPNHFYHLVEYNLISYGVSLSFAALSYLYWRYSKNGVALYA